MNSFGQDDSIRVGLIGCGQHMSEVLFPALRLIQGIKIVSIASQTIVSAEKFAKHWGIPAVESSWKNYRSSELDAVVCSGPVSLHHDVAMMCAKSGIPLFVEKPLTYSLSGLAEIKNACLRSRSLIQVGYNLRFSQSINLLKKEMNGTGTHLEIKYAANKPRTGLWSLGLTQSFLLAIAVHPLSLAQYMMGDIFDVSERRLKRDGNDIFLEFHAAHEGGRTTSVSITNAAPSFGLLVKGFCGPSKVYKLENLSVLTKSDEDGGQSKILYQSSSLKLINYDSGYLQQLVEFFKGVRGQRSEIVGDDVANSEWMYRLFDKILEEETA